MEQFGGDYNQPTDANGDANGDAVSEFNTREPRTKKYTDKGREYKSQRLKSKQTSSLAAVTLKRTELTRLMTDDNDLHLVKSALDYFNNLFMAYQQVHYEYVDTLSSEVNLELEIQRYESREKSILDFRQQVKDWISRAEDQLSDQLDKDEERKSSKSSKSSRTSKSSRESKSFTSASVSSRTRERVKLAELLAEKAMLKRKQALKVAEEDLKLETEIAKARAREKVYQEMVQVVDVESINSKVKDEKPQVSKAQDEEKPRPLATPRMSSTPAAKPPRRTLPTPELSVSTSSDFRSPPRSTRKQKQDPLLDPMAPEFHNHISSTNTGNLRFPSHNERNSPPVYPATVSSERSLQQLVMTQQQQTEHIMLANMQLAAAMSLPKPEVPKFKGEPMNYNSFIKAFDARIESKTSNYADCLYYLNQHLLGEPKELIGGCLYMEPEQGYVEARNLLAQEYGDSYKISTAYVNKVLGWSTIKYDDEVGLKRFSLFLKKIKNAMSAMSYMTVLNHPTNMQTIVKKLPPYLQSKWRDQVTRLKKTQRKIAQFEELVAFVDMCAESANDPIYSKEALIGKRTEIKDKRKSGDYSSSFATNVDQSAPSLKPEGKIESEVLKTNQCPCCKQDHQLDECYNFTKRSIEDKKLFLKERRMCFSCYGHNHIAKGCLQKKKCKTCGKLHPTALHIPGFKFPSKNSESHNDEKKRLNTGFVGIPVNSKEGDEKISPNESVIYHAILPVKVREKGSEKTVTTYAFYDNGSGGSFITKNLQNQLGATGVETTLQLGTMHGQSYVNSSILTNLIVTDINDGNPIEMNKLFTREFIPVEHNQIPTPEIVANWMHLEQVGDEMPCYIPDLEIGLLIGSNCVSAHEPLKVVPSTGEGPFAVLLRHGWTVSGPLRPEPRRKTEKIMVNRITVREIQRVKEIVTPKLLLDALAIDFNDQSTVSTDHMEKSYSQQDKLFMKKVEEGVRYTDGHYEVPLPFKNEDVMMPNNKTQAVKRAELQKRKMLKDEKYRQDYINFVENVIAQGYAEKVSRETFSLKPGKVWYIPHHGIYHPKKPEKIRVVFDCSARFYGTSLNDQLLPGPNLTNTLVGILTRFREGPIGFMADIEAMFYQVRVPIFQRNFLRFLWWPKGDLNAEMEEYRMAVHLFGAVSSPSCSNFALRKTATDNEKELGSLVAETIKRNFYVDDCLKAVNSPTSAIRLVDGLRESCDKGGFHLTKFTSNSRAVLQSIQEEERSKELKNLDLDHGTLPIERALGVYWCIESDTLEFRITLSSKPATRRGILSTVSSVYDPLGFVSPFVLPAKKILQGLCKENRLGWDDEIPQEYQVRWSKWKNELQVLEQFRENRSLIPSEFGEIVSRQIHIFSDGSFYGYGAVAYLRLQDDKGQIHCAFLMGKSRLSPVKVVTIPRLELVAATLSARLGRLLQEEVEVKPDTITYHTDSTTVLCYILNERTRFHVFVGNRVQTIRDLSNPKQWRYVQSRENPADYASRGMDSQTLLNQRKWIRGPDFLWQEESTWPQQPDMLRKTDNNDPEIKEVVNSLVVSINFSMSTINKLFESYSDWHRLKKAVAIILRVRKLLMQRSLQSKGLVNKDNTASDAKKQTTQKKSPSPLLPLISLEELEEAERCIIRCTQAHIFEKEIRAINVIIDSGENDERKQDKRKKTEIKRSSSIYKLNPFLSKGILHVGGRLAKAELAEATKNPMILPRRNHVTTLIIRHVHRMLGHAGRGHVLAALREKYWIISANAAVRECLFKCVICR